MHWLTCVAFISSHLGSCVSIEVLESTIKLGSLEADDPNVFSGARVKNGLEVDLKDITICLRWDECADFA